MSSPPIKYTRKGNFTANQQGNPALPPSATLLDQEYNALKATTDQTISRLGEIQRDDGEVANVSIGRDQLKPEVVMGIDAPTEWLPFTLYTVRSSVIVADEWWWCEVEHASGATFDAAEQAYWQLIVAWDQYTGAAAESAAQAASSASAAHVSEVNAANSASASAASASASAGSASAASGSASAAAASAVNAHTSEVNAKASADAAALSAAEAQPTQAVVAPTPPSINPQGQLWFDSLDGHLYVRYDDGTSAQWISTAGAAGPVGPPGPGSPNDVGRNLIHNPLFNVRQRGDGGFPSVGYTADRWYSTFGGGTQAVTLLKMFGDPWPRVAHRRILKKHSSDKTRSPGRLARTIMPRFYKTSSMFGGSQARRSRCRFTPLHQRPLILGLISRSYSGRVVALRRVCLSLVSVSP